MRRPYFDFVSRNGVFVLLPYPFPGGCYVLFHAMLCSFEVFVWSECTRRPKDVAKSYCALI